MMMVKTEMLQHASQRRKVMMTRRKVMMIRSRKDAKINQPQFVMTALNQ